MHLSVVSVPVSDQQRAKEFYCEGLGFSVVAATTFGDDMAWVQLAAPGDTQASITLVTWFDEMPPGSLRGLVFDTDNIDRDYQELRTRGVETLGAPGPQAGGTFLMVRDPDGNVLALHQAGTH